MNWENEKNSQHFEDKTQKYFNIPKQFSMIYFVVFIKQYIRNEWVKLFAGISFLAKSKFQWTRQNKFQNGISIKLFDF